MNPNGRQLPLEPTPELRELVERAAGLGLTRAQIAATIKNPATGKPIHQATLTDHFADELEAGQARLIAEVGTSLWRLALQGESERERRTACEFLLSRRGGPAWKERQQVDIDMQAHVIPGAHATLEAKLAKFLPRAEPPVEPAIEHAPAIAFEQKEAVVRNTTPLEQQPRELPDGHASGVVPVPMLRR